MRNPNRSVFLDTFEANKPLPKKRLLPALVAIDKEVDGHIVRTIGYEMQDRAIPVTPQSGNDIHIGELSWAIKHNLSIETEPAYVSRLGRNPFEQSAFVDALTNDYSRVISHLQEKESKEED